MHVRRSLVMLGAATSLSLGLVYQAAPSIAATPAVQPHLIRQIGFTINTPDAGNKLIRQKHVTPSAANDCTQIRGYLQYWSKVVAGNSEWYFVVDAVTTTIVNGLHDGYYGYGGACAGGTGNLYADFQCDNHTPEGPDIASGTAKFTQSVQWTSADCSYGIVNMRVEICFSQTANFGCAFSGYL
jgi:hypothetical protein